MRGTKVNLRLEVNLPGELDESRRVGRGELAEGTLTEVVVNVLELGVVKGVKGTVGFAVNCKSTSSKNDHSTLSGGIQGGCTRTGRFRNMQLTLHAHFAPGWRF